MHPQPETVRHDFAIAKCTADWRKVLASHYATDAPGQFPTVDEAEGE